MRPHTASWIGMAACVLLGLCMPTAVWADSINEKIDKERKVLEQLKDQIEEKRRQADEADKKRESILQGIQTLDERHMRYRQSHQEITRKLRKKDQEINAINLQIAPGCDIPIEVTPEPIREPDEESRAHKAVEELETIPQNMPNPGSENELS